MARNRSAIFAVGAAVILFGAVGFGAPQAHAAGASLYLTPASGTFSVGDIFTVSLYLNTGGEYINTLEADLSFPANRLQVVTPTIASSQTAGSFVQIWVKEPTYSNSKGTLSFVGAVPNPGINTSAGIIATVTFRVTSAGVAGVKFLGTSMVLLNDGYGTEALNKTAGAAYTLALPPISSPVVTSSTSTVSTTYPNQSTTPPVDQEPGIVVPSFPITGSHPSASAAYAIPWWYFIIVALIIVFLIYILMRL